MTSRYNESPLYQITTSGKDWPRIEGTGGPHKTSTVTDDKRRREQETNL